MIKVEIIEDGEFVWGGLMDSDNFTKVLQLADKLSDDSVEEK